MDFSVDDTKDFYGEPTQGGGLFEGGYFPEQDTTVINRAGAPAGHYEFYSIITLPPEEVTQLEIRCGVAIWGNTTGLISNSTTWTISELSAPSAFALHWTVANESEPDSSIDHSTSPDSFSVDVQSPDVSPGVTEATSTLTGRMYYVSNDAIPCNLLVTELFAVPEGSPDFENNYITHAPP